MKATEIIKQYNLKYDTETNCYRAIEPAPKNSDKIIYSLHEDDADGSVYFCKQVYHPDKINPKTLAYGVYDKPKFTFFTIENDLPALEHWVRDEKDNFHCSRCGTGACYSPHGEKAFITLTPFCPFCGAEMDTNNNESENE